MFGQATTSPNASSLPHKRQKSDATDSVHVHEVATGSEAVQYVAVATTTEPASLGQRQKAGM